MSLEEIYYLSQIMAVLAILVSLVFVAMQVRQSTNQTRLNTQALKASASFDAMHSWAIQNEFTANLNDDVLKALLASLDKTKSWADFSELEQFRMTLIFRTLFQKLEGQYFLFKFGSLDPALWEMRRDWAAGAIQIPFYREWWKREKLEKVYTVEFCSAIESAMDVSVATIWNH